MMSSALPPPDETLAEAIVRQNIAYHQATALLYDHSHPELTHAFQRAMLGRHLRLMRELLAAVPRPVVLDVGAGTGRLSLAFARRGWDVIALDNSPAMLEVLRQRSRALPNSSGTLTTLLSGAETFTPRVLGGRSVHAVACSSVLHHLPDYLATVERLAAVLPPGGLLYITHEPCGEQMTRRTATLSIIRACDRLLQNPQRLHKALVKLRLRGVLPPAPDHSLVDYHDQSGLDLEALEERLAAQGLRVVLRQEYADCKTALLAAIASRLPHLPNRRFSLLAQRQPA